MSFGLCVDWRGRDISEAGSSDRPICVVVADNGRWTVEGICDVHQLPPVQELAVRKMHVGESHVTQVHDLARREGARDRAPAKPAGVAHRAAATDAGSTQPDRKCGRPVVRGKNIRRPGPVDLPFPRSLPARRQGRDDVAQRERLHPLPPAPVKRNKFQLMTFKFLFPAGTLQFSFIDADQHRRSSVDFEGW